MIQLKVMIQDYRIYKEVVYRNGAEVGTTYKLLGLKQDPLARDRTIESSSSGGLASRLVSLIRLHDAVRFTFENQQESYVQCVKDKEGIESVFFVQGLSDQELADFARELSGVQDTQSGRIYLVDSMKGK